MADMKNSRGLTGDGHTAGRGLRRRLGGAGLALLGAGSLMTLSAHPASAATTVTVPCSGPNGGGPGLVAAINAANASGGGTINLAEDCTYVLTAPVDADQNGTPYVNSPITINGDDNTTVTRKSAAQFRIFVVGGYGRLTINQLRVTNGSATYGAGIRNFGTLNLFDTTVSHNTASQSGAGFGGGINNVDGAIATLTRSRVQNNQADNAGGINNSPSATLTITDSGVSKNTAAFDAGGIGSGTGSTLTITNSWVTGNTAGRYGAGLRTYGGTTDVRGSRVNGNMAAEGGGFNNAFGTVTVTNSSIDFNVATSGAGGGVINAHGDMTVRGGEVRGNTAHSSGGGGLSNYGDQSGEQSTLRLIDTVVRDNTMSCQGCLARGGAITNNRTLIIESSALTRNRVSSPGGTAQGGGIYNDAAGTASLTDSSVTLNIASGAVAEGGGIYNDGTVTLSNSTVRHNTPNNCSPPGSVPGCTG
ncbi:MAG: hypothetical protein DLM65_10210 [Candidatus Aeolococcus gillhamiae]|uniref:Right handed beta helix domain-containing protein n=1 Tax=Candidatus Aeolococcus gillhamiae TaxID=3127015 RepID=A0A2W5Z9U4_9BACT|nr:MAG: hypothetical protein DLM65_10210 [Candidatus Dormibacter sp. RRmetagenome_bin12]